MMSKVNQFTLSDLNELLEKAKAPAVADTFSANAMVLRVRAMIATKSAPPPIRTAGEKQCSAALAVLEKYLPAIIEQRKQQEREMEAEFGSMKGTDFYTAITGQSSTSLESLQTTVHAARTGIWFKVKKRGEHDASPFRPHVVDLREMLNKAWEEAGTGGGSSAAGTRVIAHCLALGGFSISEDAIRKIK